MIVIKQTWLLFHNLSSMCPPPAPTHVLSLFVKFSCLCWWVPEVNLPTSTSMRPSILLSFWLWSQIVVFLQHSSPYVITHLLECGQISAFRCLYNVQSRSPFIKAAAYFLTELSFHSWSEQATIRALAQRPCSWSVCIRILSVIDTLPILIF